MLHSDVAKYEKSISNRQSWVGDGADELVRECYSEYDGGEYVIFRPATTRKLKIVPPLTEVLEKRSREENINHEGE